MCLRALGKNVHVHGAVRQQVGEFELRGSTTRRLCQWLLTIPRICSWGVGALIASIRSSLAHCRMPASLTLFKTRRVLRTLSRAEQIGCAEEVQMS